MSILKTKTVKGGETTTILFDELSLYDIPKIMDKMGWTTASALMKHWFSFEKDFRLDTETKSKYINGPSINIPQERVNDSIVKMDWAMHYEVVNKKIDELKNVWASPKGKKRLFVDIYKRNEKNEVNGLINIGGEDKAVQLDYYSQINFREFGEYDDTIDELMGAIGVGILKVAVRGYFDITGGRKKFIVKKLGFYIKDTYDFNDQHKPMAGIGIPDRYNIASEVLGIWSRDGIVAKKEMAGYMASFMAKDFGWLYRHYKGYVPVFNRDFREWQDIHKEGGDFIVFSDVYWTEPLEKDKIIYEDD
ncbi:DUF6402 family protein [Xenorhabdus doucetiae]|uniref:Uncharacterized protein n=1 Tax=Xenorhabdus doucetiae TaxID=351671 RepID=A0A068QVD0_9GAMM|nr:DUF6402 family protein [Xenorhabdus doucetiae]TYO95736.1 hypothetical protein LY16_03501 [Xenorhabdus doucetiae]CDG18938.1 conserved protein of unknown function [Xenorhabdus doucetiae]